VSPAVVYNSRAVCIYFVILFASFYSFLSFFSFILIRYLRGFHSAAYEKRTRCFFVGQARPVLGQCCCVKCPLDREERSRCSLAAIKKTSERRVHTHTHTSASTNTLPLLQASLYAHTTHDLEQLSRPRKEPKTQAGEVRTRPRREASRQTDRSPNSFKVPTLHGPYHLTIPQCVADSRGVNVVLGLLEKCEAKQHRGRRGDNQQRRKGRDCAGDGVQRAASSNDAK